MNDILKNEAAAASEQGEIGFDGYIKFGDECRAENDLKSAAEYYRLATDAEDADVGSLSVKQRLSVANTLFDSECYTYVISWLEGLQSYGAAPRLGDAYRMLSKDDMALENYMFSDKEPLSDEQRIFVAGMLASEDPDEALWHYSECESRDTDPRVITGMGDCYMALGKRSEAIEQYKKALSIKEDKELGIKMADILCSCDQPVEALIYYLKYSDSTTEEKMHKCIERVRAVSNITRNKEYNCLSDEEKVSVARAVIDLYKKRGDLKAVEVWYLLLGNIYNNSGDTGAVEELYAEYCSEEYNYEMCSFLLEYYKKNDPEKAISCFEEIEKKSPNLVGLSDIRGIIPIYEKKRDENIARGKGPEYKTRLKSLTMKLGDAIYSKGHKEDAVCEYLKYGNEKLSEKVIERILEYYLDKGDLENSVLWYDRLSKAGESADINLRLADLYASTGKENEAIPYYEIYLSLNDKLQLAPGEISAYSRVVFAVADSYLKAGRRSDIEKLMIGYITKCKSVNDNKVAEICIKAETDKDTDNVPLLKIIARYHLENQNHTEAERLYEQLWSSSDRGFEMILAESYRSSEQYDRALKWYSRAWESEKNTNAALEIGNIYRKNGKLDDAIVWYAGAWESEKNPRVALDIGHIYWNNGKRGDAVIWYDRYIDGNAHSDTSIICRLGDWYFDKGEEKKAYSYYAMIKYITKDLSYLEPRICDLSVRVGSGLEAIRILDSKLKHKNPNSNWGAQAKNEYIKDMLCLLVAYAKNGRYADVQKNIDRPSNSNVNLNLDSFVKACEVAGVEIEDDEFMLTIGSFYRSKGQSEEAVKWLTKSWKTKKNPRAAETMISLYCYKRDIENALIWYNRLGSYNNKLAEGILQLCFDEKNNDAALRILDKVNGNYLNGRTVECIEKMGDAYMEKKDAGNALKCYKAISARSNTALFKAGQCRYRSGNINEAIRSFEMYTKGKLVEKHNDAFVMSSRDVIICVDGCFYNISYNMVSILKITTLKNSVVRGELHLVNDPTTLGIPKKILLFDNLSQNDPFVKASRSAFWDKIRNSWDEQGEKTIARQVTPAKTALPESKKSTMTEKNKKVSHSAKNTSVNTDGKKNRREKAQKARQKPFVRKSVAFAGVREKPTAKQIVGIIAMIIIAAFGIISGLFPLIELSYDFVQYYVLIMLSAIIPFAINSRISGKLFPIAKWPGRFIWGAVFLQFAMFLFVQLDIFEWMIFDIYSIWDALAFGFLPTGLSILACFLVQRFVFKRKK